MDKRKGLLAQQQQIIEQVIIKMIHQRLESRYLSIQGYTRSSLPTTSITTATTTTSEAQSSRSRHSPPSSRPVSDVIFPELEDVDNLGSLWKNQEKWSQFKSWLRDQNEGEDSDGVPLSMDRYAVFIELFVALNNAGDSTSHEAFMEIVNHKEKFFGNERCLKCVDAGLRKSVMSDIKKVKQGSMKSSPQIFAPVYQRVVDRLIELLGSYQNHLIKTLQK